MKTDNEILKEDYLRQLEEIKVQIKNYDSLRPGTSAAAEGAGQEEARHAAALHSPLTTAEMEWAMAQHDAALVAHKNEIEKILKSNKELQDELTAAKRHQKWQSIAALSALATGGTVAVTSIFQTSTTDKRLKDHAEVINNLQAEVARLKAENAQFSGASARSGSGLVGAPGVATTSSATANGASANGAAAGGPLV